MASKVKLTVRFESKTDLAIVRKAAALQDVSLNKYIIRRIVSLAAADVTNLFKLDVSTKAELSKAAD